jgi:hypothetical protein
MFLWKNAVVICVLLGLATLPATMLVRQRWEKGYVARLVIGGGLMACLAVSAAPMLLTQIGFLLVMVASFDKRVPMAATYLFFFFWAPAAGSLLAVAGAYIAPLTPFLSFAGALFAGYLLHPEHHQRRRFVMTDLYLLGFLLVFCVCVSLRAPPSGMARNVVNYFIPYMLTYHVLSRVRIARPELVLRLLLFGAAAASLLCIFETVRHWPLYAGIAWVKGDLWTIDMPTTWLQRGGIARAYGPYAHPLTGGAMLGLAATAAWALYQARGRSGPMLALGIATLLGLAATLSRSGMVAIAVGIMVFQMLRGRYMLALLMPLAGVIVITTLPILGHDDARLSTLYRLELVTGVPRALGHGVWFGYREAIQQGLLDAFIQGQGIVDLVNTYLAIVVQGGVASLVPFLVFLLSTFLHYPAIRRMRPDREQLLLAQALVAIQAALLVSLALLSSWAAPMQLSFVVAALLIALRFEVARAHDAARKAAKPAPLVATLPDIEGERLPALR